MPKKSIKVIKVPLSKHEKSVDRPQAFPRMPRLYLELIENKAKIKQDLINKEYIPNNNIINSTHQQQSMLQQQYYSEPKNNSKRNDKSSSSISISSSSSPTSKTSKISSSNNSIGTIGSNLENLPSTVSSGFNEDDDEDNKDDFEEQQDDLTTRLKQLLNDNTDESENKDSDKMQSSSSSLDKISSSSKSDSSMEKYSRSRHSPSPFQMKNESFHHGPSQIPLQLNSKIVPGLSELQQTGQFVGRQELRDANYVAPNEIDIEDQKRELLFKFELLQKAYPQSTIPEYTIHSDLNTMQKSYDDCVRRLSLDSTVENYKQYLIYGFMLVEYAFGNFLGFDMQGFTQQQIISMSSYEKLLIELGEKSYVPEGSKWPVELRLLFLIIMNAGIFIVSRMILKKTGTNLMNSMNSMNQKARAPLRRKRRMRGPNIDLDDLPEVDGLGST